MHKRYLVLATLFCSVLFCSMLISIVALPKPAFASTTSLTTPPPTETLQLWTAETTLTIAPNVPFIWLRTTPAPNAEVRLTVYPGALFKVQSNVAPVFDTYGQAWWLVQAPALNRYGWVEQHSLVVVTPSPTVAVSPSATAFPTVEVPLGSPIPAVTITPGGTGGFMTLPAPTVVVPPGRSTPLAWRVPNVLLVKPSVAYAWLRALPNSAAAVVDSVQLGGLVIVVGDPVYDGVQWWWKVQSSYTGKIGWVEQDSVERIEFRTPTPGISG